MRGQVSMEMLIAFVVLLLFFAVILSYVGQGDIQRNNAVKNFELKIGCEKISAQLNSVYAGGNRTQSIIANDFNVVITAQLVFVNKDENALQGASCTHAAVLQGQYNGSGNITITNQNKVLVFG
ncbi:MAG: hypothetical protein Q7S92_02175 [Candidatus Diapherotrites archaeon]|nr:hypothetical protein [Candidatus Diapherotrites archaeon]